MRYFWLAKERPGLPLMNADARTFVRSDAGEHGVGFAAGGQERPGQNREGDFSWADVILFPGVCPGEARAGSRWPIPRYPRAGLLEPDARAVAVPGGQKLEPLAVIGDQGGDGLGRQPCARREAEFRAPLSSAMWVTALDRAVWGRRATSNRRRAGSGGRPQQSSSSAARASISVRRRRADACKEHAVRLGGHELRREIGRHRQVQRGVGDGCRAGVPSGFPDDRFSPSSCP